MTEGPINVSALCSCPDCQDDPRSFLVVRCSVEGTQETFDEEFFCDNFNAAYNLKKEIMGSFEPIVIGETYSET